MAEGPAAFFVYGTLKRGQANYPLVAAAVRGVLPATIRGRLYDVGPFPALAEGDETVRGEVLVDEPDGFPRLLTVLVSLEGSVPSDPAGSMYLRRVVAAATDDGREVAAYAYFYNRDPAGLRHLPGGEWRGPSAAEVAEVSDELTNFGRHVRDFPRR
ncbi:MAG: gamma-glutamylcyclotransferase family protein [Thermomicrobiales bacterium]